VGSEGFGWKFTSPLAHGESNGGYCTTWLADRIWWAGFEYAKNAYFTVENAPPLWIRDCAPEKGGNAIGHKSHETGLDVDMRLPLLPPYTDKWDRLEGSEYTKKFHYDAALEQVKAIRSMMKPSLVLFNDPRFINKGLTTYAANHGNHYHIRIKPPERLEGIYK
jgi:murein endopeptidase